MLMMIVMASFLPVLKCSVSCGIGVQVRKVECVSTTMAMATTQQQQQPTNIVSTNAYGQNLDYYLSDAVSGNQNNNDDNERKMSMDAIETQQSNGNDASRNNDGQATIAMTTVNGQHLQCDQRTKPIATQPCTTGIECSPITLGTGNIDRGRGDDDNAEQIERTKINENTDADDTDTTDTIANVETDETSENGDDETGIETEVDAEEMDEIEVFINN